MESSNRRGAEPVMGTTIELSDDFDEAIEQASDILQKISEDSFGKTDK